MRLRGCITVNQKPVDKTKMWPQNLCDVGIRRRQILKKLKEHRDGHTTAPH